MRCAALFGGHPERGAAGLANDVRRSHVLTGLVALQSVDGVWVQAALFFLLVEAEPEDTTPSLARRLGLIVSLQFLQERGRPKLLVSYSHASSVSGCRRKNQQRAS